MVAWDWTEDGCAEGHTADGQHWLRVMPSPRDSALWLWEVLDTAASVRPWPTHGSRAAATFGEASTAEEARSAAERALAAMVNRSRPQ